MTTMNLLSKITQSRRRKVKKRGETVKIGHALSQTVRDKGWQKKITEMKAVNSWNRENIGKNVFANSQAYHIENGKLYVIVNNSTWMNELTFLKSQIIKNINRVLGSEVVKEIQFKIGNVKEYRKPHSFKYSRNSRRKTKNSSSQRNNLESVELKQEVMDEIDEAVSEIEDSELRESFRRVIILYSKTQKMENEERRELK